MRIALELDDNLVRELMDRLNFETVQELVDHALRELKRTADGLENKPYDS